MATASATPEKMALDRSDGSATIALYRAALGPIHTDYYLKVFTRFDAAGKTGPLWNWAAALLTLNWLLFRQLWIAALAYTGALVGAALLLVGIARLVFQVSVEVQWLLAGVALLLAVGLPGAFGNAWLYAACNKKMERALVASATLEEACAALAAKATGRKHMGALLGGNLALGAVLLALVLSWPDSHSLPFEAGQQARTVPVESLHSGLATRNLGAASEPQAAASASVPAPMASATTLASGAAIAPAPTPVAASRVSQGVVQIAAAPVAAPVASSAPAPTPAVVIAKPAPAAETSAASAPEKKHLSAREAKAEKVAKLAEKKLQARKEKAAKAAEATAKSKPSTRASVSPDKPEHPASAAAASPSADEKYLINVGLFADANNARNALAKLQDAGLPAQSQEIKAAKGTRTRVRVGPFETQAEADRVADKIRSLQLEALVFKP